MRETLCSPQHRIETSCTFHDGRSRPFYVRSVLRRIRRKHVVLMHLHQMLGQRQLRIERLPTHMTYPDLRVASLFVPLTHARTSIAELASA